MNTAEFLQGLKNALLGEMGESAIEDNLQYYKGYIESEINRGKTEEEVLSKLGDPRLIARTILDTFDKPVGKTYSSSSNYRYDEGTETGEQESLKSGKYKLGSEFTSWIPIIIAVLIVFIVLSIIGSVILFVAPVLVPAAIILFIIWSFRKK